MIPIIGAQFPKVVIPLFDQAKKSIDVIIFDWRWYPDKVGNPVQMFNQSLVRASRRGVQVRAVVNSRAIEDRLKEVGILVKNLKSPKMLHCKLIIIDERMLVIGSHNYTQSAFHANHEFSVAIPVDPMPPRVLEFFNNLWNL